MRFITTFIKNTLIKNTLITLCLSTVFSTGASFAAKPTDLVFLLKANSADKTNIYNSFVKNTVIAKDNKTGKINTRNYHVTVAWIENGKTDKNLVKAMNAEFKSVGSFIYNFGQAGIYQVSPTCPKPQPGNKKCTRNAVVLYPDLPTQESLKTINSRMHTALENYNRANGKNFKMYNDIIPENFTPHMTLADTKQVNSKNREKAVMQVNENIKNSKFTYIKLN
jgi:hypothetical protein